MIQIVKAVPHDARAVRLIAADVGGTHARLALVHAVPGRAPTILFQHKYICAEFTSLAAVLRDFIHAADAQDVRHAAVAIAGYLVGDDLVNTNLPWQVSLARTRADSGLHDLALINDFAALACAMPHVDQSEAVLLCGKPMKPGSGPTLVLGPGTGFGAALHMPGTPPRVLASEAGHAALAPGNDVELDLLRWLLQRAPHVDNEQIVSGPGLVNAYTGLCELRGVVPALGLPAQIADAAQNASDPIAVQALGVFCAMLGSIAADLVLSFGASEVYLAGGIPSRITPFLQHSDFAARFLNKGRMRPVLERVPVWVIEHGTLGVIGAARWHVG